jgi:hypothetical protein
MVLAEVDRRRTENHRTGSFRQLMNPTQTDEVAMAAITTAIAPRSLAAWLGRKQEALSTCVHAAGDSRMARRGLTVSSSAGRFGFGARTYRHPGFDRLRSADRTAAASRRPADCTLSAYVSMKGEDMPEKTKSTFDITAGLIAVEAAELLGKLERGHQEAYRVQKTYWRTREWTSRKAMSQELDAQSVDAHRATLERGLRKPGETVEQFAARARHEAGQAPELECSECGEPAVNKPTTDLVPWEAHGLEHPQWSHRTGPRSARSSARPASTSPPGPTRPALSRA